jgi:hypothetical protein
VKKFIRGALVKREQPAMKLTEPYKALLGKLKASGVNMKATALETKKDRVLFSQLQMVELVKELAMQWKPKLHDGCTDQMFDWLEHAPSVSKWDLKQYADFVKAKEGKR